MDEKQSATLRLRQEIEKEEECIQTAQKLLDEQEKEVLARQQQLEEMRIRWQQDIDDIGDVSWTIF